MPKPTKYTFMLMRALKKLKVHFRPESFDGYKHVDIVIPSSKIDIEVDGRQHINDAKQIIASNPTRQKLRPMISDLFKLLPDSEEKKIRSELDDEFLTR